MLIVRCCWAVVLGCVSLLSAARYEVRTDVEFARPGGESQTLDAHIPAGAGPHAAVILVHGGGFTAGDKQANFVKPLFPTLDETGLAWFTINYRLAPKHPYPAAVEDVQSAIRYVKAHAKEFRIDPNRIALMGESAGALLAGLVGVKASKGLAVAAVVPIYGGFDLEKMIAEQKEIAKGFRSFFGISDLSERSRALLREASASTYVRAGLPPFLLIHGTADEAVPYSQSVNFCAQLKAAGVPCRLYTVENGIHGVINWEKNPEQHAYKHVLQKWLLSTLKVQR